MEMLDSIISFWTAYVAKPLVATMIFVGGINLILHIDGDYMPWSMYFAASWMLFIAYLTSFDPLNGSILSPTLLFLYWLSLPFGALQSQLLSIDIKSR